MQSLTSVFFTSLEKSLWAVHLSSCASVAAQPLYVGSFLKVCIVFFFYFCVYVCVGVEVCRYSRKPEEGIRSPGARVRGIASLVICVLETET